MRTGLVLVTIAIAIVLAPSHAEPGTARIAEGYAQRVVDSALLELPPGSQEPSIVRAGRRRGSVGPLDVLVAMPGAMLGGKARTFGGVLVPIFLYAMLGGVFFARLRRRSALGLSLGVAMIGTVSLLFSTSLIMAARRSDASALAALTLFLLVDQVGSPLGTRPRHFVQLGLLGATLVLAMPSYALAVIALVVVDAIRRRPGASVLLAAVPLALSIAAVRTWEARVAIPPQPSGAWLHALYGLLFSPGRSVFVYAPVALLGVFGLRRLWDRDRARAETIAIAITGSLLAIAARADWHGDPAYGAPQLVPIVSLLVEPAVLFLVGSVSTRVVFATLVSAGLWVQALGLCVDADAWPRLMLDVRAATGAPGWFLDPAADIEFVPQLSPPAGHYLLARAALGRPMSAEPPFALVVASDQAEPAKSPKSVEVVWPAVWAKFDKAQARPNLAIAAWSQSGRTRLALASAIIAVIGATVLLLIGASERRQRWRRG